MSRLGQRLSTICLAVRFLRCGNPVTHGLSTRIRKICTRNVRVGVANVVGKAYLCDADRLNENYLQDMSKGFIVSAVVHGVVFALFMAVGSWIWHWGMSWIALVIAGVLYGLMSAALDRFLEKRKKKYDDEK